MSTSAATCSERRSTTSPPSRASWPQELVFRRGNQGGIAGGTTPPLSPSSLDTATVGQPLRNAAASGMQAGLLSVSNLRKPRFWPPADPRAAGAQPARRRCLRRRCALARRGVGVARRRRAHRDRPVERHPGPDQDGRLAAARSGCGPRARRPPAGPLPTAAPAGGPHALQSLGNRRGPRGARVAHRAALGGSAEPRRPRRPRASAGAVGGCRRPRRDCLPPADARGLPRGAGTGLTRTRS